MNDDNTAGSLIEHLRKAMKIEDRPFTVDDFKQYYLHTNVPVMAAANIYLALDNAPAYKGQIELAPDDIANLNNRGAAISQFIDKQLAYDFPQDKRFLLRHMEIFCQRYGMSNDRATGFGHDIMWSNKPIIGAHKSFDNSLYIAPLTGYWAIVSKGHANG